MDEAQKPSNSKWSPREAVDFVDNGSVLSRILCRLLPKMVSIDCYFIIVSIIIIIIIILLCRVVLIALSSRIRSCKRRYNLES
jgi:hypothetical protein